MQIFLLQSVWDIEFLDKKQFEENALTLELKVRFTDIFWLRGSILSLEKDHFMKVLPLLNWYFWNYYFFDAWLSFLKQELILWENINNIDYHEQEIDKIHADISNIHKLIKSGVLITKSKKQAQFKTIQDAIYHVSSFLIKTYFLILDASKNRKDLREIISSKQTLQEFRSNAYLLQQVSWEKLELLLWRFEFLTSQLQFFAEIMHKYFNTYLR